MPPGRVYRGNPNSTCEPSGGLARVVPGQKLLRDSVADVMCQHMRARGAQRGQQLLHHIRKSMDGVQRGAGSSRLVAQAIAFTSVAMHAPSAQWCMVCCEVHMQHERGHHQGALRQAPG